MSRLLPDFPWKSFIISGVFNEYENTSVTGSEIILIGNWDYIVKAVNIYKHYSLHNKRELDNYFIHHFVFEYINGLSLKYITEKDLFFEHFTGKREYLGRELFCFDLTLLKLDKAVGKIYVEHVFNSDISKKKVQLISHNILEEFKLIINETSWLDDTSKAMATEKAQAIKIQIGSQHNIFTDEYIDELYYIDVDENLLIKNLIRISQDKATNQFSNLRKKPDPNEWTWSSLTINAFYEPELNEIFLPAAMLQTPFFDPNLPNYLNYGTLGNTIGHEIAHGFDDEGRLYDKDGNVLSMGEYGMWSHESQDNFKANTKCMVDQYSQYLIKEIKKNVCGLQTLGENIADNGGMKASFRAYQRWASLHGEEPKLPNLRYSQDQLFFISYATLSCSKFRAESLLDQMLNDNHAPSEFRTNGMMSNFEGFAEAFNCKLGQKNNPVKKCSVW